MEGYLAGGQAFGPFISRNLTPCEDGEPEWTFEEFLQIMRTGVDLEDDEHPPGNTPLLQVMLAGVWQDDHLRFASHV